MNSGESTRWAAVRGVWSRFSALIWLFVVPQTPVRLASHGGGPEYARRWASWWFGRALVAAVGPAWRGADGGGAGAVGGGAAAVDGGARARGVAVVVVVVVVGLAGGMGCTVDAGNSGAGVCGYRGRQVPQCVGVRDAGGPGGWTSSGGGGRGGGCVRPAAGGWAGGRGGRAP